MTILEFSKATMALVVGSAKRLMKALLAANVTNIAKVGFLMGTTAVTVIAAVRYLKQKKAAYSNEENKTVVDRSLQLNYSDLRNQTELHPMMRTVKKRLQKDLKPNKKGTKLKNKYGRYRDFMGVRDYADIEREREVRGPVALRELEKFKKEMDELERMDRRRSGQEDNTSFHRYWENC